MQTEKCSLSASGFKSDQTGKMLNSLSGFSKSERDNFPGLKIWKVNTFRVENSANAHFSCYERSESESIFANNSANPRPNSKKFLNVNLGSRGHWFMKKKKQSLQILRYKPFRAAKFVNKEEKFTKTIHMNKLNVC